MDHYPSFLVSGTLGMVFSWQQWYQEMESKITTSLVMPKTFQSHSSESSTSVLTTKLGNAKETSLQDRHEHKSLVSKLGNALFSKIPITEMNASWRMYILTSDMVESCSLSMMDV